MSASQQNSNTNGRPVYPIAALVRSRLRQPQFYWFLGHLLSLYHFIRLHLSLWSYSSQFYHYKMCLLYITVTYMIVLYQFYRSGQLNCKNPRNFFAILKSLDNLQYFVLVATLLLLSVFGKTKVNGILNSLIIFSFFHCLNYFKENLLPFLPINPILQHLLNNKITYFIVTYNSTFLQAAQFLEIICCLRLNLTVLPISTFKFIFTFKNKHLFEIIASLTSLFFFKLRYLKSQSTRALCQQLIARMDSNIPVQYQPFWLNLKQFIRFLFDKIPLGPAQAPTPGTAEAS